MSARILLDRYGDAPLPEGYTLIEDQVSFLSEAVEAAREGKWLIRGRRLCTWAEKFFAGRRISVQEANSPRRELRDIIPDLGEEQAAEILSRLKARFDRLTRPITAQALAQALYPDFRWQALPSPDHAAEWLLWLDQHAPAEADQCLLRAAALHWQRQAPGVLAAIYEATAAEPARRLLESWLGIESETPLKELGEFTAEIPPRWRERASQAWRIRLMETQGAFIEHLAEHPMPGVLRNDMVLEAIGYFGQYPQHLTEALLGKLAPFVSGQRWSQLRRLLRPPEPPEVPEAPDEVLAWFTGAYLPFREWQRSASDLKANQRVLELARQFAEWVLGFYPRALVAAQPTFLSFSRSVALRRSKNHVILLVVLDGLHAPDAQRLLQKLREETRRLTIREDGLAFGPIPTVTQFAKEALLKGVTPRDAAEVSVLGQEVPERKSPLEQLQTAQAGDLVIWLIQEPDRTYHAYNTDQMLENRIEGQLSAVASKIADIVDQLSVRIPLRIIMTSDHGRLLSTSQRCVSVPAGMQTHGRTAWGRVDRELPASGYMVDGNLVYLCGSRYGLTEDVVVILDETAFLTSDGKQGHEQYTHGGLFPEEVIVPWIVLERDAVPIQQPERLVKVRIKGKGIAGQPGKVTVEVINAADCPLALLSIRISFVSKHPSEKRALEKEISATAAQTETLEVRHWPSRDEARRASASAEIRWPSGERIEIPANIELEAEELYSRDTSILEDLDL